MNCDKCPDFKDDTCTRLVKNTDDLMCLVRMAVMLLEEIRDESCDEGEEWKGGI